MEEGPPVFVEQGPRWLVDFLMNPPWWLNLGMILLGAAVAVMVVYRLHRRDFEITPEQQHAMLQVGGTVVSVMTGVLAMANYTSQSYATDVGVGLLAGYGSVFVLANTRVPLPIDDVRGRLRFGWIVLAVGAIVLPTVASLNGRGTALETSRFYLVVLGAVMVWYNHIFVEVYLTRSSVAE